MRERAGAAGQAGAGWDGGRRDTARQVDVLSECGLWAATARPVVRGSAVGWSCYMQMHGESGRQSVRAALGLGWARGAVSSVLSVRSSVGLSDGCARDVKQ